MPLTKIDPIDHSDLTGTSGTDCHPISSITDLASIISTLSGFQTELTNAIVPYESVTQWVDCWYSTLDAIMTAISMTPLACWRVIP